VDAQSRRARAQISSHYLFSLSHLTISVWACLTNARDLKAQGVGAEKRLHRSGVFIINFMFYYFFTTCKASMGHEIKGGTIRLQEQFSLVSCNRGRSLWSKQWALWQRDLIDLAAVGVWKQQICVWLARHSCLEVFVQFMANTSKCDKGIESVDENRIQLVDEIE
jgi:hypothetical protein